MENKYYTPKIEEFHVGFDYETLFKLVDGDYWKQDRFNYHSPSILQLKDSIKEGLVRVKYLDKEDIESLEFEFKETNKMRNWYIKEQIYERLPGGSSYTFWSMTVEHDPDMKIVKITANIDGTTEVFFEGLIKNKSELVRILKMIGVE